MLLKPRRSWPYLGRRLFPSWTRTAEHRETFLYGGVGIGALKLRDSWRGEVRRKMWWKHMGLHGAEQENKKTRGHLRGGDSKASFRPFRLGWHRPMLYTLSFTILQPSCEDTKTRQETEREAEGKERLGKVVSLTIEPLVWGKKQAIWERAVH